MCLKGCWEAPGSLNFISKQVDKKHNTKYDTNINEIKRINTKVKVKKCLLNEVNNFTNHSGKHESSLIYSNER
jgi:nitrogenase molybdenum-iron protein alpha/beta subunit